MCVVAVVFVSRSQGPNPLHYQQSAVHFLVTPDSRLLPLLIPVQRQSYSKQKERKVLIQAPTLPLRFRREVCVRSGQYEGSATRALKPTWSSTTNRRRPVLRSETDWAGRWRRRDSVIILLDMVNGCRRTDILGCKCGVDAVVQIGRES